MIKFLHCADLHLDSPLASLDLRRAEVRRNEFRAAFTSLTLYAKLNKIDFLLISGDLLESLEQIELSANRFIESFHIN